MQIHPVFHISLLVSTELREAQSGGDGSVEFEVETIKNKRINTQGKVEYLIKWQGYSPKDNTWEESTNLFCPEKVRDFEKKNNPQMHRKCQVPWQFVK